MAGGEMMKEIIFKSVLKDRMSDFVCFKKAQGYIYLNSAMWLRKFDDFICSINYSLTCLTESAVNDYMTQMGSPGRNTRYKLLCPVRQFSRYLHLFEPLSYVLEIFPFQVTEYRLPYIYSLDEITAMMTEACNDKFKRHLPDNGLSVLVGLLYVSGIRIGEALNLNLDDLFANDNKILIRKAKFGKQRWVFLPERGIKELAVYISASPRIRDDDGVPLFINKRGRRLTYQQAWEQFRVLRQTCGIDNSPLRPRIHDLRHTFAVHRLLQWHTDNIDINTRLPDLAVHMGHTELASTVIYLHITAELLEKSAVLFNNYFRTNILKKEK